LVAACGNVSSIGTREEPQSRFVGGVVVDEPRAALVGLAALKAGGTAADAAAATFFALTVTYPLAAGLAGGGACVAFDAVTGTSESVDFRPGTAALGGSVALPGGVRGIAAVHARFGRLRWSQVILPAEEMARFGFPASRALATAAAEYARTAGVVDLGPFVVNGQPIEEGRSVELPALADVLSTIRAKGGGDFYFGTIGREFVADAQDVGGRLTLDDLRQFLPTWQRSTRAAYGDLSFFTAANSSSGGVIASSLWTMVTDQDRYVETPAASRSHLIAEATSRAIAEVAGASEPTSAFRAAALMGSYDLSKHVPANPNGVPDLGPWVGAGRDGTTGFVTLDSAGSAVACVLTMNAPFGMGRLDSRLGLFFAPAIADGPEGWLQGGSDFVVPVIIANSVTGEFVAALTGTGGPAAPVATTAVAASSVLDVQRLEDAINQPRVLGLPVPDVVAFERGLPPATQNALRGAGHRLVEAGSFATVNGIICFGGATLDPSSCQFEADARGFGIGDGGLEF